MSQPLLVRDAESDKAYVRTADPNELPTLARLLRRAFINDPMMNYIANLEEPLSNDTETPGRRNLEDFQRMVLTAAMYSGGRITVVVIPKLSDDDATVYQDKIVAVAIWMPPHIRIGLNHPWTLLRSGLLRTVWRSGWTGARRAGFEYPNQVEKVFTEIYKRRGPNETEHDAWYLQIIATDPEEQGKGYMSRLVREAFAHAPDDVTFVLEATTPKSRDQYAHLGFQPEGPIPIGKGYADINGYRTSGEDATGFDLYAMVKWKDLGNDD
ncbi:hypothetical protein HETIRDRAFT_417404 [Heterobasidion irregulare TC 32-1]|uniref:N-acetyltransferase domain-containing protein n=1 Tax=Heterobasidion irregulare (strain TC 32-1) TaxID=747525 RepID=W4KDX2_HETIT|nr:uncharacterized protein HETIRDRAFT_417404 [Heterobasidion irregulare TC 32-1]ETW83515.1 hypothetical protein HETIRDRAFT_417404 [Heterobasidion irregulare TC 32-1]